MPHLTSVSVCADFVPCERYIKKKKRKGVGGLKQWGYSHNIQYIQLIITLCSIFTVKTRRDQDATSVECELLKLDTMPSWPVCVIFNDNHNWLDLNWAEWHHLCSGTTWTFFAYLVFQWLLWFIFFFFFFAIQFFLAINAERALKGNIFGQKKIRQKTLDSWPLREAAGYTNTKSRSSPQCPAWCTFSSFPSGTLRSWSA